jgi:hypothetical protein
LTTTIGGVAATKCTFWLVWNKNGANPQVDHATYESAAHEAARLASVHKGQTFIVLRAQKKFKAEASADMEAGT